jgi:hypothetical protein
MIICPKCGSDKSTSKSAGRRTCTSCASTFMTAHAVQAEPTEGSRWVITSAVSGSPVHLPFLRTLEAYCKANKATLLVIPTRYNNNHNPGSGDWWADAIEPYKASSRLALTKHLTYMGDVSIQPTAERPLMGMGNLAGSSSAIYGHTKIAQDFIATAPGKLSKMVVTTGAVTRPKYSDSKAGKKGEFHHVIGALLVEADQKTGLFYTRHLLGMSDGSFYDLDKKWSEDGVTDAQVIAITFGDLHADRRDREAFDAQFEDGGLVSVLKPQHVILHDVLDFHSQSHHNDYFERVRKFHNKESSVRAEVSKTFDVLNWAATKTDAEFSVVGSNHEEHADRWLRDHMKADDLENASIYHHTKAALVDAAIANKPTTAFQYWATKYLDHADRFQFLGRNDSFKLGPIEYSQHGDKGPNGARGARGAFVKVGTKMVIGHSHSPGIDDGVYQVGTSSELFLGYNSGFSSWFHTHCIQYQNSKRTLINVIGGKWRL